MEGRRTFSEPLERRLSRMFGWLSLIFSWVTTFAVRSERLNVIGRIREQSAQV